MSSYPIPKNPVTREQKIKKSTFICYLVHCRTRQEAEEFIRTIREKHPDASHNCWAHIAGDPADPAGYGMSDDGEPKGCAGRPMFNVLHHSGIGEICAVVTRYFGGIKLGTGGMARGYSSTVQLAIDALETETKVHYAQIILNLPYNLQKTVEHLVQGENGIIRDTSYGAEVVMRVDIDVERVEVFLASITEASNGVIRYTTE